MDVTGLAHRSPWWLPGGNAQTLWAALVARRHQGAAPRWRRQRWHSPDGDFIDVDHAGHETSPQAPLLVLFHGLEGSSASQYAVAFADVAAQLGLAMAVPHFRGCSGEINLAPRAYHSGDHLEIDWILRRFAREHPQRALLAVGVSLGGNALMRWAAEAGASASQTVRAVAAVSAPLDLAAGGAAIVRGFNRQVYNRVFLSTMLPKARRKLAQFPGLFDGRALEAVRDLRDFDDLFTAPLHGFQGVDDYWCRASAKPLLREVKLPALLLNARNDPFIPAASLPMPHEVSDSVELWQPAHGGHVGFAEALRPWGWPGHVQAMPLSVSRWLLAHR